MIDLIHCRKNCPTGIIFGWVQKVTDHRGTIQYTYLDTHYTVCEGINYKIVNYGEDLHLEDLNRDFQNYWSSRASGSGHNPNSSTNSSVDWLIVELSGQWANQILLGNLANHKSTFPAKPHPLSQYGTPPPPQQVSRPAVNISVCAV